MKDYKCVAVTITPWSEDMCDFLTAWLGDIGFDSFTTDETGVKAYIEESLYDENALKEAMSQFPIPDVTLEYEVTRVEGEDWNAEWERNYFQPIVVGDKCVVHSSFHTDIPAVPYDIVVDPKMAFGTGHHSTTFLMLSYLLDNEVADKTVIDMGTGTGILSILAAQRGAKDVYGIEIDPDAHANALENAQLNNVDINLICGDASALAPLPQADIFLANINRNIILADIDRYAVKVKKGGVLVVSGFYEADLDMIIETAKMEGFAFDNKQVRDDWTRAVFVKI
jgi:ribosomal protein L11 methyltransferase